ncbi:unnamed protein product [Strongylus vulgaris]|uniref:Amidohydrolase-related domain-containing protein n=1 Tax=Strongylus vulgaris TaxID=40348 RepID=A0A3P7JL07_STRVU|nr:unnamed protein product [Strongylus vulgaris]
MMGSTEESHVKLICEEMLPAIEKAKSDGELHNLENIDAFCEKNVVEVENTKKVMEEGKKLGLAVNFHAEELTNIGGAEMGAAIGARAMSHLEHISAEGIEAMANKTFRRNAYGFAQNHVPVWIRGVIVALGSDFNPNAYCFAMPMIMHLDLE